MSKSQLPLTALRAFEATARHLSFTKAAAELHVTQGAVSQQVAQLEQRVSAALFIRNGHTIALTQDGEALSSALGDALDQMDTAIQAVSKKPGDRTLKVKVFPTVAIRWLIPRLSSFHNDHAGLDVQITTTLRMVDFKNEDVDVSIRYGRGGWPGVRSDLLFNEILVPVCRPDIALEGRLRSVEDLANFSLLHSLQRNDDWSAWLDATGHGSLKPVANLRFGNSALAYQAALDGAGIALAQLAFVEDYVREGRLALPFPQPVLPNRNYYLVCNDKRSDLERVRIFRSWIIKQAQKTRFDIDNLLSGSVL